MKLYKPTSKFLKTYKDTSLASYFISKEGKIFIHTYPNGKIDDEGEENEWNDDIIVMNADEAIKEKYVIEEDVLPFQINQYCMSADYGVVTIAWIEERKDYNVYMLVWGNKVLHYGSQDNLRLLTAEETARYIC